MTARYATKDEIVNWNTHILANPDGGNVFSSFEYAKQKKLTGYRTRYVFVGQTAITVLEKETPPFGRLWYLPKGPNVTSTKELFSILEKIRPLAKRKMVFAIRVESELPRTSQKTLERHGLRKAAPIIPNPSTITLDISKPLDEVLTSLPQKGRHAIRRAERDGVTVNAVKTTEKNCRTMYKLLKDTSEGQFGIRSYNYYKTFWQRFEASKHGQLFFAYYDGKPVAGAYAMTFGEKSTYKDGASARKRTAYGASHLLQWKVIEWAKSRGATIHDFCGSPPSDEIRNPEHPHYGIGLFKTSFNKEVTDYVGCYDLVVSRPAYFGWTAIGERLYRRAYYKRTKDYYY
ncbi:peptidoglycan bridge formation glycyltransferase FemA/FemB family protein [Candidatus Saccharibacteria bacterium]|nr:peptidoglycan bridge formation glycyltransferase FemA/FemB family protein [Candidatus Saccharibacteria bacterium]